MGADRVPIAGGEPQARVLPTRFLEAIFENLSDAVLVCDKDLKIAGANPAAEHFLGMTAGDIIGKNCQDLFQGSSCVPDCVRQAVSQSTASASTTANLHLKNGRQRTVLIRTVALRDAAGAVEGVIATIKDITEESQPATRRIIAESRGMRDLLDFVGKVAVSEAASVFIEGENGTGKDLIARALHDQSPRQSGPFMAINCAAIPETLLESELFGYEKGAFTDAREQKRGLFELADKGTLFLDEIGEMPLSLQAKLLRVLENQTFRRLGGLRDIDVDIRIVAATNRNIREALREKAFRMDLYYRLNIIQIVVPPLRDRPQDILPLARFFIEQYNTKFKQRMEGVSPEAEELLLTYDWPGNVRELRNAIERAMILEDSSYIQPTSLPIAVSGGELTSAAAAGGEGSLAGDELSLPDQERRLLVQALERTLGNQTQAAHSLRITRDTLRYKMKKFHLR
jgi:PAS domain S-box-containing protein